MISIPPFSSIRFPQVKTFILLAMTFSLSRLTFYLMGVRYNLSSLDWFWQYLEPSILQDHLLRGLINLHSQPPGFNLFIGLILKICSNSSLSCFQAIYMILGFFLYCSIYSILRLAHFSKSWAILSAFIFIISPSSILYENWLFYTYPVAVLLVLGALALHYFQNRLNPRYAILFLLLMTSICFIRSAFHLVYLIACIPFVLIPRGVQRRKIASFAFIGVCLITILYLKNLFMFGFFGSSSWTGMNLYKITSRYIEPETITQMVLSKGITETALVPPFNYLEKYPEKFRISSHYNSTVPELTSPQKPSGHPNFNHEAYISIAKEYQNAATYIIRHYPRLYLLSVFDAWLRYCEPSWRDIFLLPNVQELTIYIGKLSIIRENIDVDLQAFTRVVFGTNSINNTYPLTGLLFLPIVLLVICIRSIIWIYRLIRYKNIDGLTFVFMTMTVMYIAVLGNAVEYGENNRFRVMTDPYIFLLAIITCRDVCNHIIKRWIKPNINRLISVNSHTL